MISPTAIGVAVGNEVQSIFEDAGRAVVAGEAEYLVSGEPTSISGFISQQAGRSACRIYGAGDIALSDRATARYERVCRPYLASIGQNDIGDIELPARGGQCAETYVVDYEFRKRTSAQFSCQPFGPWTPVVGSNGIPTGAIVGPVSGPVERITVVSAPAGSNRRQEFAFQTANGEKFINLEGSASRAYWAGCGPAYEIRGVRFRRADGSADTCGNQPPIVRPPTPTPDPTPPPFPFNPFPGVDIDIDVDLKPDGSIEIDFGTGPITVDPFPDVNVDVGGGGGGGGGVGEPGDPGAPTETGAGDGTTGEGGSAEGAAPAGSVLTGVRVDILQAPVTRVRYTPEIDRGVVYVYMGTDNGLGLETSGSMLRSGQFFFAQKDYLTKWQVRSRFGYNTLVTPYYREVEDADSPA